MFQAGKVTAGYQVSVEKGCIKESDTKTTTGASYDTSRRCWEGNLDTKLGQDTTPNTILTIPKLLTDQLGVSGKSFASISVKKQFELCLCKGHYCNAGNRASIGLNVLYLAVLAVASRFF